MTTNLELPDMPGLKSLMAKADGHPMWEKALPALVLAIATGVKVYRDEGWAPEQEEVRLACAVDEAARHFLLLAATHALMPDKA